MDTSKKENRKGKLLHQNAQYTPLQTQAKPKEEEHRFYTPNVSERIKEMINSHQETNRMRMRRQAIENSKKWFYKTEIKTVNINIPVLVPKDLRNQTTLQRISIYSKAAYLKLQHQTQGSRARIKRFEDDGQVFQQLRKKGILLKKKLVNFDMDRQRIKFLLLKQIQTKTQFQNSNTQINDLQTKIACMKQSIKQKKIQDVRNKQIIEKNQLELKELNEEIVFLTDMKHKNALEIKKISPLRMPNQRNIINQMFLIGILCEQIYILDFCKSVKPEVDLSIKKVGKEVKQREKSPLKIQNQELIKHIRNRKVYINCQNSEVVVFKVLTAIYMHCKSLFLNNINTLMQKMSFFSTQFKQIYDFKQFDKYMSALINRYKESIDLSDMSESTGRQELAIKSGQKLLLVSNENSIQFIRWIMRCFEVRSQNIFSLRIDYKLIEIELITAIQLRQRLKGKSKQVNILSLRLYQLANTHFLH